MKPNPVCWFEISVSNMSRSIQFYESVLKTQLTKIDSPDPAREMYGFPSNFESMGTSGALVSGREAPADCGGTTIYFSCDDCADEISRVESAGGKLMQGKTSIGQFGFFGLAQDPDGNLFGLHSLPVKESCTQ